MTESTKPSRRPKWRKKAVIVLIWLDLLLIITMLLLIRFASDRWWIATLLLFSPRWVMVVPLIALAPFSFWFHKRSLWVLGFSAILTVGPFMGLCIPWRKAFAKSSTAPTIRVLACNIHHKALDQDAMAKLINESHPDIVSLEEWTPTFRSTVFTSGGWYFATRGELCVASRFPIHSVVVLPTHNYGFRCKLAAPSGPIDFFCVHLESPHYPLRDAIGGEPDGPAELELNTSHRSDEAADLAREAAAAGPNMIIAGDFNLSSDSTIYRKNLRGFTDAFAVAGFGFGYSYHSHWTLTRIDHILCGSAWSVKNCWLGPNVQSPHRPVLADIQLNQSH